MKSRRRSLSASRTLDSTVNFVGRIGASLRISVRRRAKQRAELAAQSSEDVGGKQSDSSWVRLHRRLQSVRHQSVDGADEDLNGVDVDNSLVPLRSSRSLAPSPVPSSLYSGTRSCPATPQTMRRRYLKEGPTQLTSLNTLMTHHRYLFLINDLLLVSKQKHENSYNLKEKIGVDRLWISSNNCSHSFLIGWPICNYVAHFSTEEEKNEWYQKLSDCIQRATRARSTTVNIVVKVEGRSQTIRKTVDSKMRTSDLLNELVQELDLSRDPLTYELGFESALNGIQALHGIECVYAILMDYVARSGATLSDAQMSHLDTCPLVQCRLVLRPSAASRSNSTLNLVNQFRKVLSRSDSKRLFGRELEGSMPPQPVLTMIDHLATYGTDVEGIFRKSPKRATVRALKTQLDNGQVPDFHQFNVHVTASLLKEYLRGIPGQLLLSGNYRLWLEMVDETDAEKKAQVCRNLLRLLPQSHMVLLRSILRLSRRIIAAAETSKMSAQSLAVCIAPSLLEHPDLVESARKVPLIAEYLVEHAPELFDGFDEDSAPLLPSARHYQSTDSGLSDDPPAEPRPTSVSPDSALFDSPISDGSMDGHEEADPVGGLRIEELPMDSMTTSVTSLELESMLRPEANDKDRTPCISRENSDLKTKVSVLSQWRSSAMENHEDSVDSTGSRRSLLSPQSSVTSDDHSNEAEPSDVRVLRIPSDPFEKLRLSRTSGSDSSRTYVTNPEELRVSDLIISHKKTESTDSTKTIIATSANLPLAMEANRVPPVPAFSAPPRESFENHIRNGATPRDTPVKHCVPTAELYATSTTLKPSLQTAFIASNNSVVVEKPPLPPSNVPSVSSSRTRMASAHTGSLDRTKPSSPSTAPPHRTGASSRTNWPTVAAPPENSRPEVRSPELINRCLAQAVTSTFNSRAGSPLERRPWRPPKKTAEEILLNNLEVNWSVSDIRSVFQQQKDDKPPMIETVYATVGALKKQTNESPKS